MLQLIFRLTLTLITCLLFLDDAGAQTNAWSSQGPSGCSDQYGNFDAFIPGMRGSGACNRGGFVPGTNVIVVTNRNSSGAGSLDAAASAACPKVILFGVAGLINQGGGNVNMNRCDNWSIVGASAPGNVVLAVATNGLLLIRGSDYTVDNMTIAAGDSGTSGGSTNNRDSVEWIDTVASDNGIFLNNNLIWGTDEIVQCYSSADSSNILMWQNFIGIGLAGSGSDAQSSHLIMDTCPSTNSIRNFYIHGGGRQPTIRGHGYFHANNFTANPGWETSRLQPCTGLIGGAQANPYQNAWVNNFLALGGNSRDVGQIYLYSGNTTSCTTVQIWEEGSVVMNDNNTLQDCSNHACNDVTTTSVFQSSPASGSGIWPTGYVVETIIGTQGGLTEFATKNTGYAGARPTDRLPYITKSIDEGINTVDGVGPDGTRPGGTGAVTTSIAEGGLAAITPTPISGYDPTDSAQNPCAEDMPTGATANAITSAGLTRLHEWAIGCFYDDVMPAGYREDQLQFYGASAGGESEPPAVRPNPPTIGGN